MSEQTEAATKAATAKPGKYLTFALASEAFGLEILKVREIIGMTDITSVPLTPPFIKGIINLRGRVIPVMDLRTKFGMPPAQRTAASCIIVVYVQLAGTTNSQTEIGIIVDRVSEVMAIAAGDIEEAPSFGGGVDTRFLCGVSKTAGKVTLLVNIDKALTDQDVEALSVAAA